MSEPLVVHDGACGLCRATVPRLAPTRRLRLTGRRLPYQAVDPASYGLNPGPWEHTCAI